MIKSLAKGLTRRVFETGQRFGVNITPKHFYSALPDIGALREERAWRAPFEMAGVAGADLAGQIAVLDDLCRDLDPAQWAALDVHGKASAENGQGGGYGIIEAEVLNAYIRRHRPRRVVQIGCGVSTSIILRAGETAGYQPEVICIEPYPSAFLTRARDDGRIRLVAEPAQLVDRDVMCDLAPGDMLFVDSTHTVKPGSEVNRIILDVLPRLGPDIHVHFHDIYFPYDYQRELLTGELFFNVESTLLHAFLIGNARVRIALSLSMLHHGAPGEILARFPRYEPQGNEDGLRAAGGSHFPSATYLTTHRPVAA
ncbi:MAG: class I SAM-dependent methyltransferase [Hyphomicrobiaceae bacterium]